MSSIIKCGKDELSSDTRMGTVYRINCTDCNSCYIGQTKRQLKVRINEHRSDIKKHQSNWSVVSKHRMENGHTFDWSNVAVLHQEKYLRKREMAEMLFIKRSSNAINLQKDTDSLPGTNDLILTNISSSP
ncbi:hypothetical protein X777_16036 [Ooceraea biroi]|uniref:GIY-YIG domain-containing protein n=1 Tax=Ooceraea biroi TaxID=2015173 RepID=A0A026WXG4_OOCBI|nr:hypothetical protein X777_16036 [Ooceraea biroi]